MAPMVSRGPLALALISGFLGVASPAIARDELDLIQLLASRECRGCHLNDADLMHADLRDADLKGAHLRRANLSHARLDGADLSDTDLSFTSLQGASLRGTDLRNSRLVGTDLRRADLTGARLNQHSLERSHWLGAIGIEQGLRSPAALHNAGVDEAQAGRWPQAERLFGEAIQADPEQAMSWIARGLSRGQQGDEAKAAQDLLHAADLLEQQGSAEQGEQVRRAVNKLQTDESDASQSGNGVGSALLGGALSTLNALAPLALKTLLPGGLGL